MPASPGRRATVFFYPHNLAIMVDWLHAVSVDSNPKIPGCIFFGNKRQKKASDFNRRLFSVP